MHDDFSKEIGISMILKEFCLNCKEKGEDCENFEKCKAVKFAEFIINKVIAEKLKSML